MLKSQVKVGGVYKAKVNGRVVSVRVDDIQETGGYRHLSGHTIKASTRYHVTNLTTGRTTTFRSASKFRGDVVA